MFLKRFKSLVLEFRAFNKHFKTFKEHEQKTLFKKFYCWTISVKY
jgi:hypothetical protein